MAQIVQSGKCILFKPFPKPQSFHKSTCSEFFTIEYGFKIGIRPSSSLLKSKSSETLIKIGAIWFEIYRFKVTLTSKTNFAHSPLETFCICCCSLEFYFQGPSRVAFAQSLNVTVFFLNLRYVKLKLQA